MQPRNLASLRSSFRHVSGNTLYRNDIDCLTHDVYDDFSNVAEVHSVTQDNSKQSEKASAARSQAHFTADNQLSVSPATGSAGNCSFSYALSMPRDSPVALPNKSCRAHARGWALVSPRSPPSASAVSCTPSAPSRATSGSVFVCAGSLSCAGSSSAGGSSRLP